MSAPAATPETGRRPRSWKRTLIRWALNVIFIYVGVIIVLSALENWMVYHPTPASEEWVEPATYNLAVEDVELHTADGIRLHAWWCPVQNASDTHSGREQDSKTGALLYCHGNAGNLSFRAYAIPSWHKYVHVPVLIFDYPGYGKSAGKPSEQGCYAAADAAYDWLTQKKEMPPEKILIYGGSMGGGVAVDIASRRPHRALILAKTFTSMPDVGQSIYPWLPVRWVMRNRFDNLSKISQFHGPVFIAHGTADNLVPFRFAKELYEAANEPKHFYILEGRDHNDAHPPEMFQELRKFLNDQETTAAVNSKSQQ
jgi:fermentation-respiration switch protein FrsA (DUF1100 family)